MQRYFNVLTTQYIERKNINNNNKNLSMMKKNYLLAVALALTAMVSCTDESFVGDQGLKEANEGVGAISFNLNVPAVTRADKTGSAAATDLNNQFIVWGEKSEAQGNSGADGKGAVAATNLVFQNYQVNYVTNSAFTTTSNTEGWEYVGYTHSSAYQTNITTKDASGSTPVKTALTSSQTIKYWDWGADRYTFTAVSADPTDIEAGNVTIKKLTSDDTDVYGKGYQIVLAACAAPTPPAKYTAEKIYIADRKVIEKSSSNTDRTIDNTYGGNVTLTFRNILTHVRVGMYENIPGYTVTVTGFTYKNDGTPATFAAMKEESHTTTSSTNFVANAASVAIDKAAILDVTYQKSGSTVNQPTIAITTDAANKDTHLQLGSNITSGILGETAATARFDQSTANTYTSFYPQEANSVPLKLMVNYTLTSPTGETITVQDATAEIPAAYLQWKPNFKYTYLFKISDNSNGSTGTPGTDPAGLYPITFDAVETIADDGSAEYITTVSEPSITTFGAIYDNTSKFKAYVTGKSDYKIPSGTDKLNIYATIMDNSSVADFTFNSQAAGGVNVYKVSSSDDTNFPVTEASVAEALAEISSGTKKITCTPKNEDGTTSFSAVPAKVTTVPGEDGVDITINALRLSGVKEVGQYAIEYVKTPATYHTTEHTYASSDAVTSAISGGLTLYKNSDGTTLASSSDWVDSSTKFYSRDAVKSVGVYTYKIVTVTAAD